MAAEDKYYDVNGVRLHTVEHGIENNTIILFLHGFPEFGYAWKEQLPFFAEKGFRAIAVDQRGYNLSSKPKQVAAYHLDELVEDIKQLVQRLTAGKIVLVGHDWGGGVAWRLAQKYPELLDRLIILNMGHPGAIKEILKRKTTQKFKSWYVAFFQIPVIPELLLKLFDFKYVERSMTTTSKKGTFTKEKLEKYKLAWSQPSALRSMINWYRANKLSLMQADEVITTPTLIVWGAKDAFLVTEMAEASLRFCLHGKLVMIEDATHWLHHEQPKQVNDLILNFIKQD